MIIDCHCHAGSGDILSDPWNTAAPLNKYLQRAQRAGIKRTVVFAPFHSDYAEANRQVAAIVRKYPNRLIGFAFVHVKRDRGRIFDMVNQAVREWGFRGIKIHGYDAMPNREVCDVARAFRIPILVDIVGRAHAIDMFAPEYPAVPFIIPHFGSFHDDWRAQGRVVDQLVRYPNVFADTSGVRRYDYIVEAIRRAGPRKVLFGSDGPWLHPGAELAKVKLLGLPPKAEALVTGGNILRLLRSAKRSDVAKPSTPIAKRSVEIVPETAEPEYAVEREL